MTDGAGISDALGLLMSCQIASQKSFGKGATFRACPNLPAFITTCRRATTRRAVLGTKVQWEIVETPEPAVDDGEGLAAVNVSTAGVEVFERDGTTTASDPGADPTVGANSARAKLQFRRAKKLDSSGHQLM
ncbi:hypothetical protein BZM26_34965 [Paraburkholderia strydomiana]|nr:hypothetical protein BZM26_34965 [Paraburkholderia strydomiana]